MTTTTTLAPSRHAFYRRLRRAGWPPRIALSHVRNDQRLADAEDAELIRFRWEWDDDYDPGWNYGKSPDADEASYLAEEIDKLVRGYWEVQGCIVEVPARTLPGVVGMTAWDDTTAWENVGSLWGIVGPFDSTDADYRRDVEISLAYEAGVLT